MSKVLSCNSVFGTSTIVIEDSDGKKYTIIFVGKDSTLNSSPKKDRPCWVLINGNYPIFDSSYSDTETKADMETKNPFEVWDAGMRRILYTYDNHENKVFTIHVSDTEEDEETKWQD